MRTAKSPKDSASVISQVMMPVHANHYGRVHGGTILKLVDDAAFVTATKHSRRNVVTASIDNMIFSEPVNIGDILTLKARLVYVGTSSMEILVDILTEKLKEGKTLKVGKAWLTMVALGDDCRPVDVPALRLSGPKEKALSRQALLRRKRRLQQL